MVLHLLGLLELLRLHLHLLLLLLLGLEHPLKCIRRVIPWSVWHRVFSDRLVLYHRRDDTLGRHSLDDVVAGGNRWHGFLLVDEDNPGYFRLLTRIENFKTVDDQHSVRKGSELPIKVEPPQLVFPDSIVIKARRELKIGPLLLPESIFVSNEESHVDEGGGSVAHEA